MTREKFAVDKSFQRCCKYRYEGKALQKDRKYYKTQAHRALRRSYRDAKPELLLGDEFLPDAQRATGWQII
jgi:hypothetical protein